MSNLIKLKFFKRQPPSSLLGLALDGSRLEGVVLRRTNGSLQVNQRFSTTLSLDPLANDAELVGREILNQLQAAGVRERNCVVALPLKWALAAHTQLPKLAEADVASFLQIEAERGFPTEVATLQVATSRLVSPAGEEHVMFVGVPRSHVERLEQVLRAAKLKPLSFSLPLTALQPATGAAGAAQGVLALAIGENHVGLQITCGGGVAALRALEGAAGTEAGERILDGGLVAREARITLGQLPADLRDTVKQIRVFGPRDQAESLAAEIRPRLEPGGLRVEVVAAYAPNEFSRALPSGTPVSPAFSLAARQLTGRGDPFEFLPPKVSAWEQMAAKYASGKLRTAGAAAAALVLIVGGLFGFQEWQLSRLRQTWAAMSATVADLQDVSDQIVQYRPWYDDSFHCLNILKQLTAAFPQDGSLTAKTVEIRDLNAVSCTGNAASYAVLLNTVHELGTNGVSNLNIQARGKSPMQFSFDYRLAPGGPNEN